MNISKGRFSNLIFNILVDNRCEISLRITIGMSSIISFILQLLGSFENLWFTSSLLFLLNAFIANSDVAVDALAIHYTDSQYLSYINSIQVKKNVFFSLIWIMLCFRINSTGGLLQNWYDIWLITNRCYTLF